MQFSEKKIFHYSTTKFVAEVEVYINTAGLFCFITKRLTFCPLKWDKQLTPEVIKLPSISLLRALLVSKYAIHRSNSTFWDPPPSTSFRS